MPKIRRQNLPPALLIICSSESRSAGFPLINSERSPIGWTVNRTFQKGKWFKRFPGMTVCGESELVKTFLARGQVSTGKEIV